MSSGSFSFPVCTGNFLVFDVMEKWGGNLSVLAFFATQSFFLSFTVGQETWESFPYSV